MNLGRVMIATFMVAIFLGPRRWMDWAAQARDHVAAVRVAVRARREPPDSTTDGPSGSTPGEPPEARRRAAGS